MQLPFFRSSMLQHFPIGETNIKITNASYAHMFSYAEIYDRFANGDLFCLFRKENNSNKQLKWHLCIESVWQQYLINVKNK